MIKKLQQIGNSWGFIIPKAFLELLRINPVMDDVEINIVDNELRIKKANKQ